jgi:hypothetical protein
MPSGENGRNTSRQHEAERFLLSGLKVSGLKARTAELRPFFAIPRVILADFSALQTDW